MHGFHVVPLYEESYDAAHGQLKCVALHIIAHSGRRVRLLQESMHDRAVRHNVLRLQRRTIRRCDVSRRSHTQNIKFARHPCADARLDGVIRPAEQVEVPERSIVEGHCRYGT